MDSKPPQFAFRNIGHIGHIPNANNADPDTSVGAARGESEPLTTHQGQPRDEKPPAPDTSGFLYPRDELSVRRSSSAARTLGAAAGAIYRAGLSNATPEGFLDQACAIVGQALGVPLVSVFELEPAGSHLTLRAGSGWDHPLYGQAAVCSGLASLAGYCLLDGAPVSTADYDAERRFRISPLLESVGARSGAAAVIAPAAGGGVPYGALAVHDTRTRRFSPEELAFLEEAAWIIGRVLARHEATRASQLREQQLRHATRLAEAKHHLLDAILGVLACHHDRRAAAHDVVQTITRSTGGVCVVDLPTSSGHTVERYGAAAAGPGHRPRTWKAEYDPATNPTLRRVLELGTELEVDERGQAGPHAPELLSELAPDTGTNAAIAACAGPAAGCYPLHCSRNVFGLVIFSTPASVPDSVPGAAPAGEIGRLLAHALSSILGAIHDVYLATPSKDNATSLTHGELEVLDLYDRNLTYPQIAHHLKVETTTVKWHTKNIRKKLDACTTKTAAAKCRSLGLIPLTD